jgi:adenylylsulfate kinase
MIIWLTGQPGSGKSTIANLMSLEDSNVFCIDGDELRKVLGNPGYGEDGRRQNIKNAQNIALFAQSKGFLVVVSLIAPYRDLREEFKKRAEVCEVYLHTEDVRGRENFFVKEYEPPLEDFLDLDTGKMSITECVDKIKTFANKGD